jgi:MEKHLA domain
MNDTFQKHQAFLLSHSELLLSSYRHWLKRDLIPSVPDPGHNALTLFQAPFVVVSSSTDADQTLNYGNQTALHLWKMPWEVFCGTPSRQTAEPVHQEARAALLHEVREHGFIDHYEGVRISSQGERFRIQHATVWNLVNDAGQHCGQAATFSHWTYC